MAIQFNLLPWREALRAKRLKRNQTALVIAGILGVLAAGGFYAYEKTRLDDHERALQLVKSKNQSLQGKLKEKRELDNLKIELNKQIDSIEALQADRASVTHMVEELSKANSQQLSLTEFRLKDGSVNISGIAENDAQISDLMKQLRNSEWYKEPELVEILSDKKLEGEIKRFRVNSQLLLPGTAKIQGGK